MCWLFVLFSMSALFCQFVSRKAYGDKAYGVRKCVKMCEKTGQCLSPPYTRRDLVCSANLNSTVSTSDSKVYVCKRISKCEPVDFLSEKNQEKKDGTGGTRTEKKRHQISKTKGVCPRLYVRHEQSCYFFEPRSTPHFFAFTGCKNERGHLVDVEDAEEDTFIVTKLLEHSQVKGYWTGGGYTNDQWVWSDGSPVKYTRWRPDKPKSRASKQFLIYCSPKYEWASCKRGRYGYICEQPAQ